LAAAPMLHSLSIAGWAITTWINDAPTTVKRRANNGYQDYSTSKDMNEIGSACHHMC